MSEDDDTVRQGVSTHRGAIKYRGAVVAGGLAGCVGGDSGGSDGTMEGV